MKNNKDYPENMAKSLKTMFQLIIVITFISCGTNKATITKSKINTKPNEEYIKSRKSFSGKLTNSEYNKLKIKLESELNTVISEGKTILINYNQKAPNCISYGFSNYKVKTTTDNRIRISSGMSSDYNTVDFFVFNKNVSHQENYQNRDKFILDSGFFYDNIFTLHENCAAFIIIKPNGDFLKYYGEDYFSEVKSFLEKE